MQDSEGAFTIAGSRAVRKMARYQLPFRAAWAVKIVQCAVKEGAIATITVELTARAATFHFHTTSFTTDQVEEAFCSPLASLNAALGHLITALWGIGFNEGWPFQLTLAKSDESLVWDGQNLHRLQVDKPAVKTSLVVSLNSTREGGWLNGIARSADLNAQILTTLKRYGFTSPIPLVVDGRRVDSLQACWGHGFSSQSFPLAMGFAQADIPDLPLSPGTFDKQPTSSRTELPALADGMRAMQQVSPKPFASVPYLLSYHYSVVEQTAFSEFEPSQSLIYWVRDGVVVQSEPLLAEPTVLSLGCFVSADGLECDLTTFHLVDNPERRRRREKARLAVVESIGKLTTVSDSMEELAQAVRGKASWNQKLYLLAGFGTFWVSPVAGLLLAGAGWLSTKSADARINERSRRYQSDIAGLLERLKSP